MSELLTTGQMIDRLKVGEVAESEMIADCLYRVKKRKSGSVMKLDIEGEETGHYLDLHGDIIKLKWHILPTYVSFEEAMKAYKEGKTVKLHFDDYKGYFTFNLNTGTGSNVSIPFGELLNRRWTIEDGDEQLQE